MEKKRVLWIDLLNICACICVLLLHTNFQYLQYDGSVSLPWLYGCIIFTVAYWAVPVFIMLSTCNLLNYQGGVRPFYVRRLERIGIPFLFWSIVYAVLYYVRKGAFTWQEGIDMFVHGTFCRYMWFFTPLFGLYLSMPFLKVFVQNASKKLVWLFIAFGFVFDSVLPFLFDVCDVNFLLIDNDYKEPAFFAMASNFVYIGVLGYMLTHVDIPRKYRMCIYSVGALTAIIHFCLLVFGTISTGKVVRIELNYFYPSSVLIPMAVIVFFRYTNWDKLFGTEKSRQIIAKLAGCSLGVYLLQYLLQIIIGYFDVPLNNCLTGFALLYVLGVVITLIVKKIPVINKLV